jgi:hypothetical protein
MAIAGGSVESIRIFNGLLFLRLLDPCGGFVSVVTGTQPFQKRNGYKSNGCY